MKIIRSFEGLRGLASLLVVLYHIEELHAIALIKAGYLSVDLFFIVSGFVMCLVYLNNLNSLVSAKEFIIKRIGRLFPLLIASYGFYFVIENLVIYFNSSVQPAWVLPSLPELLATFTMTFGLGLPNIVVYNFASWSISAEFYTYLVFALLCIATSRKFRLIAFLGMTLVAAVALVSVDLIAHQCATSAKPCLDVVASPGGIARCIFGFFAGCVVHAFASRISLVEKLASPLYSIIIALLAVVLVTASTTYGQVAYLAPLCFMLLTLSVSNDLGPISKILSARIPQELGRLSYSMYLLHMPLLLIFKPFMGSTLTPEFFLWLSMFLLVLFLCSEMTYRLIEVPGRAKFARLAISAAPSGLEKQHINN